jgi:hypothetical protein
MIAETAAATIVGVAPTAAMIEIAAAAAAAMIVEIVAAAAVVAVGWWRRRRRGQAAGAEGDEMAVDATLSNLRASQPPLQQAGRPAMASTTLARAIAADAFLVVRGRLEAAMAVDARVARQFLVVDALHRQTSY